MNKSETAALVRKAQAGDKSAFETLYNEFFDKVFFFAKRNAGSEDAARDITSETFTSALEHIGELRSEESFVGWLYSIAYSKCVVHFREEAKTEHFSSDGEMEQALADASLNEPLMLPEDYAVNRDTKEKLKAIIDGLPSEQRSAVILYYYDDMSVAEVAKTLGLSESNAKQKLRKARAVIRKKIEKLIGSGAMFAAVPLNALLHNTADASYAAAAASGAAKVAGTSLAMKLVGIGAAVTVAVGVPIGLSKFGDNLGNYRPYENTVIEYDTVENVKSGISEVINKDHGRIIIPKDLQISFPEELGIYKMTDDSSDIPNVSSVEDPFFREAASLLFDPDDFDKSVNPSDDIVKRTENQGSISEWYSWENRSKNEVVSISRSKYIFIGAMDSVYLNDDQINPPLFLNCQNIPEEYQRAVDAADSFAQSVSKKLYGSYAEPVYVEPKRSEDKKQFYCIKYMIVSGSTKIWPFGTEGSVNTVPGQDGSSEFRSRFYSTRFEVIVDSQNNICNLTADDHYKYQKDRTADKIATLESVVKYLDSELAENITVNVDTIAFCYAFDNNDRSLYPVWVFEFDKGRNKQCENRIIVNAVNGRVSCMIDGYYKEF